MRRPRANQLRSDTITPERLAQLRSDYRDHGYMLELLAHLDTLTAERDAYKRAKEENDERYMIERDEARRERDEIADRARAYAQTSEAAARAREDVILGLVAERDELAATLANERGEGPPPSEGWEWMTTSSLIGVWRRSTAKNDALVQRTTSRGWYWTDYHNGFSPKNVHPTARAAMRAADAAVPTTTAPEAPR